jgi:DNA-binding NtrC family response regulator
MPTSATTNGVSTLTPSLTFKSHAPTDAMTRPLPPHIIAASEEMRELVSIVRAIAPTSITVLLIGESGTGKEVFAQLLHDLSGRSGPFVTVNCGAIPEGLIESELFGHEKGAFTGAIGQRKGFFEAAQGGTLFLDEIGEMPLALQVKLLRVLETGTFTRVGSTASLSTDARIIAATNRDLDIDVRAGSFRADLYYRLRAVMLRIPPLRNRREDIPFLIESMLGEFVVRHAITDAAGRPQMPLLTPDAIDLLITHEWRGNIRELRNTLEQLVVLSCSPMRDSNRCVITGNDVSRALASSLQDWAMPSGRPLPVAPAAPKDQTERELIYRALIELRNEMAEIKSMIAGKATPHEANRLALPSGPLPHESVSQSDITPLDELETEAIRHSLAVFNGNRRQAAQALGISERTLYRKMKEKGLDR